MKPGHVLLALVSFAAGVIVGHLTAWFRFSSHIMEAMEQVVHRPGAQEVRCVAKRYTWHFQYPGEDGELAEVNAAFVTETNPAGLNPADPRGRDDKVSADLVLPCQRQVDLSTASHDLIHSLGGLPGVKDMDATPEINERRFFETSETPQTGRLSCVQLCGPGCKGHVASFRFIPEPEFLEWLQKP